MTDKDTITKYLEKMQMWQRMAQGIADVSISLETRSHGIIVTIMPRLATGECICTDDGDMVCKSFGVWESGGERDNEQAMLAAYGFLKQYAVL